MQCIKDKYPHLDYLISYQGTVKSYYSKLFKELPVEPIRLPEYAKVGLRNKIVDVFGESDIADDIVEQVELYPVVSTAEHHGLITHPELVNAVLDLATFYGIAKKKYIPSFSCATVKMKNELEARRVYSENGYISLYGMKYRNVLCLKAPPIGREKQEEIFSGRLFSEKDTFEKQVSELNRALFRKYFREPRHEYVMLPLESWVLHMLSSKSYWDSGSFTSQILSDPEKALRLMSVLDGTRTFWDVERSKGTFLFWGLSESGKSHQLMFDGEYLCGEDGFKERFVDVPQLLNEERILPAPSLNLLILMCDLQLVMFGGIFQVSYLKEAVVRLHKNRVALNLNLSDQAWERLFMLNRMYVHFRTSAQSKKGLSLMDQPLDESSIEEQRNEMHGDAIQGCLDYLEGIARG